MFDASHEGEPHGCLAVLGGEVRRFPDDDGLIVPHMGWNGVRQRADHPLLDGIPDGAEFYFVHSYYCAPDDAGMIVGETDYGLPFPAIIARGAVAATQFHPEKSGRWGLRLLRNFARLVAEQGDGAAGRSDEAREGAASIPAGRRP